MRRKILLTALLVLTLPPLLKAQESVAEPEKAQPEAKVATTAHQITLGGKTLAYTVNTGTMLMKNETDEPMALFGFTAYVVDGADKASRPILFAYNGGPGSASIWLHMGVLGPERAVVNDAGFSPAGPFQRVANEYSILDEADLVMMDPVGTGFSKPATPHFATEHVIDHMNLPQKLRENIQLEYYEAGHMMYVHEPSLVQFKADLAEFVRTSH